MIRELTKSAMSFSWALSLLGLKQAGSLFRPGQQRAGDLLAPMTQVAVDQLDNSLKGVYRTGDNLQGCAVDMAFAWLNPGNWMNPNAWLRPFAGHTQRQGNGQGNCQNQSCDNSQSSYNQGQTYSQGNGGPSTGGNGFTQAAAGIGQAISQAASGFTQAVGQATAGLSQAVAGFPRQQQNAGNVSPNPGTGAPVNNESAAAGWGPMPGDS